MERQVLLPLESSVSITTIIPCFEDINRVTINEKDYAVDGTNISITWREIVPPKKELLSERVVIFFPGWPLKTNSNSIVSLCCNFANVSGREMYIINTKADSIIPNSLFHETRAVCRFLEERKIKEVILVGYSQGGIKAVETAVHLREMHDISVSGLILIATVGINQINSAKLVKRYATDILFMTLIMILREVMQKPSIYKKFSALLENTALTLHLSIDFLSCIWQDIRAFKFSYISRLKSELHEMTKLNPYLDQVNVPVILIQGARDRVSDSGPTVSKARDAIDKGLHAENSLKLQKDVRNYLLSKNLFVQSPYVRVVEAEKFGTHLLPLFRSKSVARVSLYLLERSLRVLKK